MKKNLCICLIFMVSLCQSKILAQSEERLIYNPKATQVMPTMAKGFLPGEVKLLDGIFKESQDAAGKNLLSLDLDRLLAPFVLSSGGYPKQPMYLGWESRALPGVALSFFLSGTSRMFKLTGNKTYLERLNYILNELSKCQALNDGYLLGTLGGKNIFTRVENEGCFPDFGFWGRGEATPYYSLEKLMSGLRDAYRITNNPKALQISIGIGDWVAKHMSKISDHELQKLMLTEYGGMNWVLADLYADTGDKRFLDLSNRWQDSIFVVHMIQGEDILKRKHANSQFPKISGLAARYPFSGKAEDLFGAKFFWEAVVNHHSYVTGGNSESELFGHKDSLSHRLTPFTEENCNEYNLLRLTKLLYEIEPKVEYADYIERTLFNHILPAQNTENGQLCYFLPLMPGAKREYQPLDFFSCCTCSGLDSYTRHAEYIYDHSFSSLYVNLFIASEVNFKEKGITLKQETDFPDSDLSRLTLSCNHPTNLDLAIRNPYWANNSVTIQINGKEQKMTPREGYFHISRTWNNHDVVELKLPMKLRTESMPDDKNMLALFYGPVLLAADLNERQAKELVKDEVAPALVPGKLTVDKWLIPSERTPLTFNTGILKPEQVKVVPLFRKKEGEFSVYWNVLSEGQWQQRMEIKQHKSDQERKIELVTLDKVSIGDSVAEINHKMFGPSETGFGNAGILGDQKWRRSTTDAIGYELAVSDSSQNTLFIKFIGKSAYESWNCCITIDGKAIKTLKLIRSEPFTVNIWQDTYPIPPELTKGKKVVKVAIEPVVIHKMQMPRVVEIRTLNSRQL